MKRVREKRQSRSSRLLLSAGTDNAKEEDEGVKGRSEWTKVFSTLDRGGKEDTAQTRVAQQSLKLGPSESSGGHFCSVRRSMEH